MSRRRANITSPDTAYSRIPEGQRDSTDGFHDEQFKITPRKFPWKTVIFVLLFLIGGALCLGFGILFSTGYFDKKYDDRSWPLLILGIIMFIPGGYYGYILICICFKREGFTLDDIPIL